MSSPLGGLAVAVMTALFLFSFAGYQVTGDTAGPRLLGRLASSLVEVDRWTPVHRDDIQLLARDRPNESVLVDDLPVDVLLPAEAVLALNEDDAALSELLRDSMGQRLYTEGRAVLQDDEGETHLGVTDPVRWAVSMLSADAHTTWRLALIGTGLVAGLFAASFVLSRRSPLAPMAAGAGIAIVASFFGWLVGSGISSMFDSAVDKEIASIFQDSAWLGLRNSLAAGAILLALLYLNRSLLTPRLQREDHYWPDAEEAYPTDPV